MRYWTLGLLGVAVSAAAVAVVAWCTWALTRANLCTAADASLACERSPGELGVALAVALVVAIPVGSKLYARRKAPRGAPLGPLALGLALAAAGGAAVWSARDASASAVTEAIGLGVGVPLLAISLFAVIGGLTTLSAKGEARAARIAELKASGLSNAEIVAHLAGSGTSGGDAARGGASGSGAHGDGADDGDAARGGGGATGATAPPTVAIGTLAAQLSQIAAARRRTGGDALAARLRQLDDLRASGLLTAAEHAAKRRELLDEL